VRLGFAVKVIGQPGLKSHDTRRWQNNPHLSVSLAYLRDTLLYLQRADIRMYRLTSELAPYITHPELPQFHSQIDECLAELAAVGELARTLDIRLSFHPSQYILLNAPDEGRARKSFLDLQAQARLLDEMGLGMEAVIVTHVGGVYEGRETSRARFAARYESLPESVRRRLVLENDDRAFGVADTLWIHQRTGIRLVFDVLHHQVCNPDGCPLAEALAACLATWPPGEVPKIHFSTPSTALRGNAGIHQLLPRLGSHADLVDPFSFIHLLRLAEGMRAFDVMLEQKGKDLALLKLRKDLERLAPELVAQWDIH